MGGGNRKSGIRIIGDIPWGTHFCQFYETPKDLTDVLVPYFKAGLEGNEYCIWVTAEPLVEESAREAMRKAMPDFDRYLEKGQIEILPHDEWYLKGGVFDLQKVLDGWIDKLDHALKQGYDGLRVTGNTAWLEKSDWKGFTGYEAEINKVIGNYRMIAICTYSIDRCSAAEVIDVVNNHQFALIRRQGKWQLMESAERRQAEQALRESEERYRQVFESIDDFILVVDLNGQILDCNQTALHKLGYSREEFLKLRIIDIVPAPFHGSVKKYFKKLARGEKILIEAEHICKDGHTIPIEVNSHSIVLKGERVILSVVRDISERKRAQEKAKLLEEELAMASRLATVGEMAAGIAHEINNPLTGVLGFSDLLLKRDIPEDMGKDVKIIYEGARRIASITGRMLRFARQSKPERTEVNINDVIEVTLALRAYEMKTSSIKVTTELAPDLPLTYADAGLLQQVFLNIILNAEQAMKLAHGKGKLTIKTERIDNTIRASFKDDGPGIARESLDRIFDPFFTTREVGQGTGLGLSVSHGIVTQHGGKIYARSRLGKGATLFVELPIVTSVLSLKFAYKTWIHWPVSHQVSWSR